jgi:crossover junction endodeoxyribonuclease RusA
VANVLTVTFVVDCSPVAQPRHQIGRGKAYIPRQHPIHAFKMQARMRALEAKTWGPLKGPFAVTACFFLPGKSDRASWHLGKPDVDNLAKSILDAIKGVYYVDDCQVASLSVDKVIAGKDDYPHVEVTVRQISDTPDVATA